VNHRGWTEKKSPRIPFLSSLKSKSTSLGERKMDKKSINGDGDAQNRVLKTNGKETIVKKDGPIEPERLPP